MPREGPVRLKAEALGAPLDLYDDAGNLVLTLTAAGALRLATAAGSLGFFGTTPIAKPAAYTQTFATADKTHANATAAALTDNGGGGATDNTIAAITGDQTVKDAVSELADEINKLVTDLADVKQLVNAVIDDLQALGLVG